MTRLNTLIPESLSPSPSPAQNLLTDLLNEVMRGMTTAAGISVGSPDLPPHVVEFFEQYYVKHDVEGQLPAELGSVPHRLSTVEADLLRFLLTGDLRREKVYILCDHAGKGKSTVAKYVCWYLIPRHENLRNLILPIYISIFDHTHAIKSLQKRTEVNRYLDDQIQRVGFVHAYDHLAAHTREILEEAHRSDDGDLQGMFPPTVVEAAAAGFPDWFTTLPEARRHRLVFYALLHYGRTVRPLVVVLDDADRLEIDTQRFALEYLYGLIALGAFGVLAMRRSTYQAMIADIRDKEHHLSAPIQWSPDSVRELLLHRISKAEEKVELRWGMHVETTASKVAGAFIGVLRRKESVELLAALSNENLHSLFGKLQLVAQSQYFKDSHVLRELLISETGHSAGRTAGAQLWLVLSMLLGNYRGTFRSHDEVAKWGLVNVFCTREMNHSPFTQFIRLHLLARLINVTKEDDAVPVSSLREEYMSLFGDDTHFTPVFARAMRRLIIGALVFTTSCRRYQDERAFWPNVLDDAVFISPAGRYYLVKLLERLEYLWFMKDDIDWRDKPGFSYAATNVSMMHKGRGALAALAALMRMEYEMLDNLRTDNRPGMAVRLQRYVDLFSARRVPLSDSILYTELMQKRFCDYLKWKFRGYEKTFGAELEALDAIHETNARTREAFS